MNHFVELQVIGIGKGSRANITLVWAFLSMYPMVLGLGRPIGKGGWAVVTFVWSIPSVRVHVSHQLLVLDKATSTDPAKSFINRD